MTMHYFLPTSHFTSSLHSLPHSLTHGTMHVRVIWQLWQLYVCVAVLPVLRGTGEGGEEEGLPAVHCHPRLCGLKQAFYVEDENITRVYVSTIPGEDREVCVSVDSHSRMFCYGDQAVDPLQLPLSPGLWIDIPLVLIGRHTFSVHHFPRQKSLQRITHVAYFIQQTKEFPQSAWMWSEVSYPSYGAVIDSRRLLLKLQHNEAMQRNPVQQVFVRIKQVKDLLILTSTDTLDTQGLTTTIQPGSYFVEIGAADTTGKLSPVHSAGYVEHVLPSSDIKRMRRFYNIPSLPPIPREKIEFSQKPHGIHRMIIGKGEREIVVSATSTLSSTTRIAGAQVNSLADKQNMDKRRICIWASDAMDGQKNIWLQQMKYLNRSEYDFTCILSENKGVAGDAAVEVALSNNVVTVSRRGFALKVLRQRLGRVVLNPTTSLPIRRNSWHEIPGDGSPPFSAIWDGSVRSVMAYIVERVELFEGREDQLTPQWVRDFVVGLLTFSRDLACDVMVYGNDNANDSDAILPVLAQALDIPSVSELLSVFVRTVPTVIVGPSHYAIEQPTVSHANSTDDYRGLGRPKSAEIRVISPGLDTDLFDPENYRGRNVTAITQYHWESMPQKTFVIGFVGRLSIEKNVGLFLLAAQLIIDKCSHCRFTVVGDGPLRENLELLCSQLGISAEVIFTGWQPEEALPAILAGMDVVVNPSMAGETFCITNIEAMAMEIPLITFAVGGVGEYVCDPRIKTNREALADNIDSHFWQGSNAIVLDVASPEAIAAAVLAIAHNPLFAEKLGSAGRQTVQDRFTVQQQMMNYDVLYKSLT